MLQVEHVQQQCDFSCGIACVAMITGTSFETVLGQAERPGLTPKELDELIMLNGGSIRRYLYPTMRPDAVYVVSVASLNNQGGMHFVVVDTRESAIADKPGAFGAVFDPNEGREGKLSYGEIPLVTWGSLVEVIDGDERE